LESFDVISLFSLNKLPKLSIFYVSLRRIDEDGSSKGDTFTDNFEDLHFRLAKVFLSYVLIALLFPSINELRLLGLEGLKGVTGLSGLEELIGLTGLLS